MYPSSIPDVLSNRARVDNELASFFAGTQARSFREISLTAGASLYVRMLRPVDIVIRRFGLFVNAGELRCDIYRGATPAGVWSESLPVIAANEMSVRPGPTYVPKSSIEAGALFPAGRFTTSFRLKRQEPAGNNLRSAMCSRIFSGRRPEQAGINFQILAPERRSASLLFVGKSCPPHEIAS